MDPAGPGAGEGHDLGRDRGAGRGHGAGANGEGERRRFGGHFEAEVDGAEAVGGRDELLQEGVRG